MFGTNADIIIFGKIGHFQRIIPPSSTQLGEGKMRIRRKQEAVRIYKSSSIFRSKADLSESRNLVGVERIFISIYV